MVIGSRKEITSVIKTLYSPLFAEVMSGVRWYLTAIQES